jgi:hypothetical protein
VTRRRLFCAMVRAATPSCASTDPCARARTDHVERRISALSGTQSKRFGERKKKIISDEFQFACDGVGEPNRRRSELRKWPSFCGW